ncbi:MAG TPA: hypothetical protein VNW46_14330 [Gemmatimonadaceae bacterium]|nr:hypothetical protein [Gemmatimonadaceae bacterium]
MMRKLMALAVGVGLVAAVGSQASAQPVHPPYGRYGWHGGGWHDHDDWHRGGWHDHDDWHRGYVYRGGYGYGYGYGARVWVPGYWAVRPWGRVWIGGCWR